MATIYGGSSDESLSGGGGNDTIYGYSGDDFINGAWGGDDLLYGGYGDDALYAYNGRDTMWGGEGNDRLSLWSDGSIGYGENGHDRFSFADGADATAYGGDGDDSFLLTGSGFMATGDNFIDGGSGNDLIQSGAGSDTIYGGDGNDFIDPGDINTGDVDYVTSGSGRDLLYLGDLGSEDSVEATSNFWLEWGTATAASSTVDMSYSMSKLATAGFYAANPAAGIMLDTVISVGNSAFNSWMRGFGKGAKSVVPEAEDEASLVQYTDWDPRYDTVVLPSLDVDNPTFNDSNANIGKIAFSLDAENGGTFLETQFEETLLDGFLSDVGLSQSNVNNTTVYQDINQVMWDSRVIFESDSNDNITIRQGDVVLDSNEFSELFETVESALDAGQHMMIMGNLAGYNITADSNLEYISGSTLNDVITISSTYGNDQFTYRLALWEGDDIVLMNQSDVNIYYNGGDGSDTVSFAQYQTGNNGALTQSVHVDLRQERQDLAGDGDGLYESTLVNVENVIGTKNDDVIIGNEQDNIITGNDGADSLYGGGGDDSFLIKYGEVLDSVIDGGAGEDKIVFGLEDAGLFVTNISWSDIADTYSGLDGIEMTQFDDIVNGSRVSKVWAGDGNDTVAGGYGNDILYGDAGEDTIFGDWSQGATHADSLYGGDGNDKLYGDSADGSGAGSNDYMEGGFGTDLLIGGGGDDQLKGDEGTDTLYGNDGDDILYGQRWGDGGTDADFLYGGAGNDKLYGDAVDGSGAGGNDSLVGGAGKDTIISGGGDDEAKGQDGDDIMYGNDGNDVLYGGSGLDALYGGDGHDQLKGGDGNDILSGGDGNDKIYGNDYGDGGMDSDTLYGGAGNDELNGDYRDGTGDGGDDVLDGGAGDDILRGGGGNDMLGDSDIGNDTLYGGDGDDLLAIAAFGHVDASGNATNKLYGGSGSDVFYFDTDESGGYYAIKDWDTAGDADAIQLHGSNLDVNSVIFGSDIQSDGTTDTLIQFNNMQIRVEESTASMMTKTVESNGDVTIATNTGEGCFITTATAEQFGWADDCRVLETLRWFRDNVMAKREDWKADIATYYALAPEIVARTKGDKALYQALWHKPLRRAVSAVASGNYQRAYDIYSQMFKGLVNDYLPGKGAGKR
ncbi:calcium-binding protein [Aestuariispira insulae]|uniref:Ca2+-binding RTX toxin-like protein n=1 Tax=Aestuariispira insulae TaxID=1461337 RepID=A0A3D9H384_9PROT|nr:calcium-binding protein [Aestuariispira insulae]RED43346.1 Ca2+-binding RTX toxin-like protein [Aestuariispira insulae]